MIYQRASTHVLPADPAVWKPFIEGLPLLQECYKTNKTDTPCRCMWTYDFKNASSSWIGHDPAKDHAGHLFRTLPMQDKARVTSVLIAMSGPDSLSPADRKTGSVLGQMNCEHCMLMFDGRRLPEHAKNLALLNKYIGGKSKNKRGCCTFRVMHSNEEFVSTFAGGIHARVSPRNAHTTKAHTRQRPCGLNGLPDPLESVAVWMSDPVHKSLAESRPLRYPIFGVSTCTRSLVNMPLRAGYGGGCQREEPSLWVSLTNAKAITKTMVKATVTKETAAAGDDRSGDDKSGEENDGGDDKSGDKSGEENDGDDHDAAAG